MTGSWAGFASVAIFVLAYVAVMAEERLRLRKSQPMLLAAGLVWLVIGVAFALAGDVHTADEAIRGTLEEFAELFLFLLVAMTYVNTMEERGLFDALRAWLVGRGYSLRTLFWVTGGLAFIVSVAANNLTTALLLGAVAVALGKGRPRFVTLACVNIVVAANAGGTFSPFGDITTLMVWQKAHVPFEGFFVLFLPSLVNWLIPAAIMSLWVEGGRPEPIAEQPRVEPGSVTVALLFAATIALTVVFRNSLNLPPAVGMMAGLGVLKMYSYVFNLYHHRRQIMEVDQLDEVFARPAVLDIFRRMEQVEWDTLMFFYGVTLCVGGLGTLGYLAVASRVLYDGLGHTTANVLVGALSAVIDNVPIMFAVLTMNPAMSEGQWLLVTLTAGVGGSLLSIGSAAGVALMGQARGVYTFGTHLRWAWAIALGYVASVAVHLALNRHLF